MAAAPLSRLRNRDRRQDDTLLNQQIRHYVDAPDCPVSSGTKHARPSMHECGWTGPSSGPTGSGLKAPSTQCLGEVRLPRGRATVPGRPHPSTGSSDRRAGPAPQLVASPPVMRRRGEDCAADDGLENRHFVGVLRQRRRACPPPRPPRGGRTPRSRSDRAAGARLRPRVEVSAPTHPSTIDASATGPSNRRTTATSQIGQS